MQAVCRKCNQIITDPDKWNGSFNGCKPCRNLYLKERRKLNPMYKVKAKARYRANSTLHKFSGKGLEVPKDWDEVDKSKCEICQVAVTERTMRIDHSYKSGAFRGILCNKCNVGLGMFHDSPEQLVRAAEYVRAHQ